MTVTSTSAVRLAPRFARSARLDTDLSESEPLAGYILQASVRRALTTMASAQSENHQGAFTWTGPYGGGKSSAALLVANFVGGHARNRTQAQHLVDDDLAASLRRAFPQKGGTWAVIPVTGSPADIRESVATAAGARLDWTKARFRQARSSNGGLIEALQASLGPRTNGVLLILDELGKFLEHAAGTGGDVQLLQDLAEFSSRSQGRFALIGILHQAFERYADRASREARREWAKVQGRFQDIPFVAGVDETVALLGRALVVTKRPESAALVARAVAKAVAKRRPTDQTALADALSATWPLNPVTSLLLGPVSRQRFAQNERSVFGFLNSAEPHGLVEFLNRKVPGESYGPDQLWDYLVANFGPALAAGGDGNRFSVALEAIDRAAAKGDALHVALTKTAAVVELFRNGSGLATTKEILQASLPSIAPRAMAKAISKLVEWSILLPQLRLGSFAIFSGSDFDVEAAIEKTRTTMDSAGLAGLPGRVGLGFAVARRHYFRTGALRAFEILLQPLGSDDSAAVADLLCRRGTHASGVMVVGMPSGAMSVAKTEECAKALASALVTRGTVAAVAAASLSGSLAGTAADLFALDDMVREHPQLEGDRIARREIASRRSGCLDIIEQDLRRVLDRSTWWLGGVKPTSITGSLSAAATALAESAFHQAPIIRSELIQRDQPSSNAMAAVRELCHAMVRNESHPELGFTAYPAEMGLYLTVLRPLGLHREVRPGEYAFVSPDDSDAGKSLRPAWAVLESSQEVRLGEVYRTWGAPPIGMKAGAMPIIALASILARRDRVAVYVDDVFQTSLDTAFVDRLLQNPQVIRLRAAERSIREARLLRGLASGLGLAAESPAISIAQALYRRVEELPAYTKRTRAVTEATEAIRRVILDAKDPERLLFDELPALQASEDVSAVTLAALDELERVYPALLEGLRSAAARALGVDPVSYGGVGSRARVVLGLTNDLRFDAFANRVLALEAGEGDVEGLASLLVHKPPRSWSDRDREQALLEVAKFCRRFREAEALAVVRERRSTTEALALVVGLDPALPPMLTSFELTEDEKVEATRLATAILKSLDEGDTASTVRLAALARAVASLVGDGVLELA